MSVAYEYIFDDLREKGWRRTEQEESVRLTYGGEKFPRLMKVPIKEFSSDENMLRSDKPVEVIIVQDEGIFYASSESLDIEAEGESISDVLKDFSQHICYFFSYYSNKSPDEVVGNAARLKSIYETHFNYI